MSGFWSVVLSGCRTFVNWYWGGFDGLIASLAVFVAVAHVTSGMCAAIDRRPLGRAVIQDIFKSTLIFILVGIGNILDTNVLTSTPALRTAVILFYLSVEGMILLENAVYLGLPVPKQLKEIFCKNPQNLVKQRITPHFLTTDHPNYYEFTTKE